MTTSTAKDQTDLPGALGAEYAADDEHRPLVGYAVLTGVFGAALTGGLVAAHRSGRELPERLDARDVLLAGIATHKLSRLITKDKITSALRAPFTRFQEKAGHGELEEAARGRGLRFAIGELLVCPYCIAQWVAGAFTLGYVFAPRVTRLLAAMWTAHAIADAAQLAYSAAEDRS
jgi:hypothetical protein